MERRCGSSLCGVWVRVGGEAAVKCRVSFVPCLFCVSKCKYNSEEDTSFWSRHVRGFWVRGREGVVRIVVVVSLSHRVGLVLFLYS